MINNAASSTIFCVFGMTRPGIERRSSGPLANTLTISPIKDHEEENEEILNKNKLKKRERTSKEKKSEDWNIENYYEKKTKSN